MSKLLSYLNKPASYNTKPWVVVIIASLLVCFLLGFFQPFGIENFSATVKLYVITGFTLVTTISTSIVGYLFPYLFRKFYNPSKWTIWKNLLNSIFIILIISCGNFLVDLSMGHRQTETFGSILFSYILVTLLIGIIPSLVSMYIVQNNALKRNLNEATLINDQLSERLKDTIQINHIETDIIELTGKTKETVVLYPDNILFLESSGNYVKINYLLDDTVKHKQIRTTISQIEKELQNYKYIVRCHRAYMVNILYIDNVEGNSLGLQLNIRYLKERIPVSRSYIKEIKDKL